jgi:hypothetical protein
MTTQIMFKIEDKLKKAAQKRARKEGITLSDFYQSATKSFVEGRMSVGITMIPTTSMQGEDKSWQNKSKENMLKLYSKADAIYDSI